MLHNPQFLGGRISENAILANLGFLVMLPVCFKYGLHTLLYFKHSVGKKNLIKTKTVGT